MAYKIVNNIIQFSVDGNKLNITQRNNEYKWAHPKNSKLYTDALSACNVSSYVMAGEYIGYKFPKGRWLQDEDNFCEFIFTDERVMNFYKEKLPIPYEAFERGDINALLPNTIHIILAYAFNLWIGTNAVTFNERTPIETIVDEIIRYSRPVVLSGTFPYLYKDGTKGTIGHINTLVGLEFPNEDIKTFNPKKATFIVDDPYGDWKQNFAAGTGNNTRFTYNEFIKYYKYLNETKKMAHIFKDTVALI